eukprot:CAMPEP_0168484060 /NCGR_PEP_ID=MMETSP0228-20121227/65898_1 /TAXON_ID=133427 /ORGANISM="Protoceratium reticulatum, Strain CCCM 535 (=CCMP 1889)" /LENGTH=85 /DNA_ID=CAMNT_0008500579 /DNA_START=52 /DNA_END=305 /DNA_ORIENTATION=+
MAPTRALLTCRDGALYANTKEAAEAMIARYFEGWTFGGRDEGGIAQVFRKKVELVANEMASQAAVSMVQGVAMASGGRAAQAARP